MASLSTLWPKLKVAQGSSLKPPLLLLAFPYPESASNIGSAFMVPYDRTVLSVVSRLALAHDDLGVDTQRAPEASVLLSLCVQAQSYPTLCVPTGCSPPGSSVHGLHSPGKNTAVGCHFLLQGFFPTQGLNPCLWHLLHWQADSLPLAPPGKSEAFSGLELS